MTTLNIQDLPAAETLSEDAMRELRGGYRYLPYFWGPTVSIDKTSISKSAEQLIGQTQVVSNANGNNVAFADHIRSTVNPTQTANNTINF